VAAWRWLLILGAVLLVVYAAFVAALVVRGRRVEARAVAGFVPDCVVLFKRLLRDDRVPRRHKALVLGLLVYLATPIDLVPDFIPVAGQLDDALLVALVLRGILRASGDELLGEHWPGPDRSLRALRRFACGPPGSASPVGQGDSPSGGGLSE